MSNGVILEEDVVHDLQPKDGSGRVGVLFLRHAAIYFLHEGDPHFREWLRLLEESRDKGARVRFAYEDAGQKLTLVELVR